MSSNKIVCLGAAVCAGCGFIGSIYEKSMEKRAIFEKSAGQVEEREERKDKSAMNREDREANKPEEKDEAMRSNAENRESFCFGLPSFLLKRKKERSERKKNKEEKKRSLVGRDHPGDRQVITKGLCLFRF